MSGTPRRDAYTHGHHASVVAQHGRRTAEEAAAFLLPRLRPGMRLLDAGCGPGSITAGLRATAGEPFRFDGGVDGGEGPHRRRPPAPDPSAGQRFHLNDFPTTIAEPC